MRGEITAKWRRIFKRTRKVGGKFDRSARNRKDVTYPMFYAAGSGAGILTSTKGWSEGSITWGSLEGSCRVTLD